jgi:hypothetical protein
VDDRPYHACGFLHDPGAGRVLLHRRSPTAAALPDDRIRRLASYPDPRSGDSRHVFYAECVWPTHVRSWREWVREMRTRKGQAYAVLCLCRALYTDCHGEQLSKPQAARWAQRELPEWGDLIGRALDWRAARADEPGSAASFEETVRFVEAVGGMILRTG